jgi:hypothetical protein
VAQAKMATSQNFETCRSRVHDDAFEAQLALHMVTPLLGNTLKEFKLEYLHKSGVFFRRALVRYLTLALYRLLDKPNDKGPTGITVSIASLLGMAKSEGVLAEAEITRLTAEIEKIKADGANGEYDLMQSIRDLRNIQVAHSLIPKKDPTDQLWAHHLLEFAEAVFNYVADLDATLAAATGVTLADLRKNADEFEDSAGQFWRALTLMK